MDFPSFDGTQDPLSWLNKAEHFFTHQHTLPEDKVSIATYHLDGEAQLWSMKLKRDNTYLGWTEFKRLCNQHFGPVVPTSHYGELAKLCQTLISNAGSCNFWFVPPPWRWTKRSTST